MAVEKFTNLPRGKSGPNPSDKFVPLPHGAGSDSLGATPAPGGSATGTPAIEQRDGSDNMVATMTKRGPEPARGGAARERRPADVDKGFDVLP